MFKRISIMMILLPWAATADVAAAADDDIVHSSTDLKYRWQRVCVWHIKLTHWFPGLRLVQLSYERNKETEVTESISVCHTFLVYGVAASRNETSMTLSFHLLVNDLNGAFWNRVTSAVARRINNNKCHVVFLIKHLIGLKYNQ